MPRPLPIEVPPAGLGHCGCVQPWNAGMSQTAVHALIREGRYPETIIASHGLGWFVCQDPTAKGAEDGLCDACRTSDTCTEWREQFARELASLDG